MTNDTEQLWNRFSDQLRHFIRKRVTNEADVEDILQNLFLKVQKDSEYLEKVDKPQSWLYRVVRNAIIDYYRTRKPVGEYLDIIPSEVDLTDRIQKEELVKCLMPLIDELSSADRDIIELIDIKGIPQKEVSESLGISLSGTKSRIQRARKRIRNSFLQCCSIVVDSHGQILDYSANDGVCNCPYSCSSQSPPDH